MATEVHFNGPIFDGRAAHEVDAMIHEMLDDVGQQGYSDVMSNLDSSIRNPTPYYETQINVKNSGLTRVVNDRGIIYGPWLEGTGSRNSPVTRFPGYASFRRAHQKLEGEVPRLIAGTVRRHVARMQ